MKRVSFFKSLSFKLGLASLLVVAGAMAIAYLAVVPRLESRLVDSTYESLSRSFGSDRSGSGQQQPLRVPARGPGVREPAQRAGGRLPGAGERHGGAVRGLERRQLERSRCGCRSSRRRSRRAARRGAGSSEEGGSSPRWPPRSTSAEPRVLVLLSAPLADRLSAVEVVRRDLLIYGGVAVVVSSLVGALAALRAHPQDRAPGDGSRADRRRRLRAHDLDHSEDELASSRGRSTGCAFGSRISTAPAASSSRTPRTSSVRPCSPSGGFSSF